MQDSKLISFLKQQSFQPGPLSIFINPFFFIRRSLFKNIKRFAPLLNGKLLDFGCGRKPYENLFSVKEYIGVDIEKSGHDHSLSRVDVYYDGEHIPFPDGSFDSLFCSEVFEHVFVPEPLLREINRVLKSEAVGLITVPFCWNEHELPFDYARYTSVGLQALLERCGFKVLQIEKSGNFAKVNFQLWALYFFELFKRFGRVGYVVSLIFIVPINVFGSIISLVLPRNKSMYFNSIMVVEKERSSPA